MHRYSEIDTVRGGLLVTMALTHLPTRFSQYADQPLGFVSTAEAFIFLSAFLVGRASFEPLNDGLLSQLRRRAWERALRLYYWHLGMLVLVFTLGTAFAQVTGRQGLKNLLSAYFADPFSAALGSLLLAYQPPLLDILPIYIVFLAATPLVLGASAREGWGRVLALSLLLWLFAQMNGRALLFGGFAWLTGWPLPLESLGAFDWLAWQVVWVAGLAAGLHHSRLTTWLSGNGCHRLPLFVGAVVVASGFFLWRHGLLASGLWSSLSVLDKWHLGILRLVNFAVLALLVGYWIVPLLKSARLRWVTQLGRASLQVFCAHVVACLVCVALMADAGPPARLPYELLMIVSTLAVMLIVAIRATAGPGASHGQPQARLGRPQEVT
jgi:hypothetical protein